MTNEIETIIKKCNKCHKVKSISGFAVRNDRSAGYYGHCKACDRVKSRGKYHKNIVKARTRAKKYYLKNPEKFAEKSKKLVTEKNFKYVARYLLRSAVESGKVNKLPCEVCGDKISQAHHHDYKKPLEVMWVCRKHHGEQHRIYN